MLCLKSLTPYFLLPGFTLTHVESESVSLFRSKNTHDLPPPFTLSSLLNFLLFSYCPSLFPTVTPSTQFFFSPVLSLLSHSLIIPTFSPSIPPLFPNLTPFFLRSPHSFLNQTCATLSPTKIILSPTVSSHHFHPIPTLPLTLRPPLPRALSPFSSPSL